MGFCRRLLKRLTSQEGAGGGGGGGTPPVSGPPSRDRRNSGAADTSTQRLMLAQRQFHGHLIDYELIFAQVNSCLCEAFTLYVYFDAAEPGAAKEFEG